MSTTVPLPPNERPIAPSQSQIETRELPPPRPRLRWPRFTRSGAPALAHPVGVIVGTGPELTDTTTALRQVRLLAAAIFLFATSIAFLIAALVFHWQTWWMLIVMAVSELAAVLALSMVNEMPRYGLRLAEFFIFGVAVLYLAATQYNLVLRWGLEQNYVDLLATIKNTIASTMILSFAYCMLIPNTWKAAGRVVLVIWAAPFIAQGLVFLRHPEVAVYSHSVATASRVGENVLTGLIAAGLAIYGTHVLSTLRREAFEQRQLNQYRLRRKLGEGGMGAVYLAEHQFLKRPCALKMIHPGCAGDAVAQARFEREVQATAQLTHPNTIEIYDYGRTAEGVFFYVMEYLPGLSLDALVARHGPLPAGRVIYFLRQACEALAEAHTAGLVHRDMKPGNLFAAERGGRFDVIKILDFGLVKSGDGGPMPVALTAAGRIRGTPQFMAPEQVTGAPEIDGRSDLYALGGVAYCLLTGRPPFEGDNSMAVMVAHARDPVDPPSHIKADVPADLERIVLRCLEKQPADRYPDALSLGRALAACAAASDWDADRATQWWGRFEPDATRPPSPD